MWIRLIVWSFIACYNPVVAIVYHLVTRHGIWYSIGWAWLSSWLVYAVLGACFVIYAPQSRLSAVMNRRHLSAGR